MLASIYNSDTQPGWLPFGGAYKGSQWPLSHLLESAISKKPCCFKKSPKFLIDSWCRPQKSLLGGSEHFLHLKTTKPCRLISTFQSHWTFHTIKLFCFNCLHCLALFSISSFILMIVKVLMFHPKFMNCWLLEINIQFKTPDCVGKPF